MYLRARNHCFHLSSEHSHTKPCHRILSGPLRLFWVLHGWHPAFKLLEKFSRRSLQVCRGKAVQKDEYVSLEAMWPCHGGGAYALSGYQTACWWDRSHHYRLQQTWGERWLPCAALCGLGGLSRLLQVCLDTCWQLLGGCKDWLWVFGRMHERPATCQIHRAQSVHGWISTSKVGPCWGVWIPATVSKQHQSAMWVPLLLELAKDHCYVKKHAPSPAGSYMGCNPEDDFPWPRDNSRKAWFCFLPSCWRKLAKLLQHLKSAALHDSPRSLEVQKVSLTLEIDQPEDWSNYWMCACSISWVQTIAVTSRSAFGSQNPLFWVPMFFPMFSTAVFFHMAFLQCRNTEFSSCDQGSERKAQVSTSSSFQLMFHALIIINQALHDLGPCK